MRALRVNTRKRDILFVGIDRKLCLQALCLLRQLSNVHLRCSIQPMPDEGFRKKSHYRICSGASTKNGNNKFDEQGH